MLSTEAIAKFWRESEFDIQVNLKTGQAFCDGKVIAEPDEDGNPNYQAISDWMQNSCYFPSVWLVNDHGNVTLVAVDEDGKTRELGGLV